MAAHCQRNKTWNEFPGLRNANGQLQHPGAAGVGLRAILLDATNPGRNDTAVSGVAR